MRLATVPVSRDFTTDISSRILIKTKKWGAENKGKCAPLFCFYQLMLRLILEKRVVIIEAEVRSETFSYIIRNIKAETAP